MRTDTSGFCTAAEIVTRQAGQTEFRLYYQTGGIEHYLTTSAIVGPQIFTFSVINSSNASEITFGSSTLQNGVKAYADRTHVWSAVPSQFQGTQFVRMRQGDKENASLAVQVTATQDLTLILLIDNRVGDNNGSSINTSPPDFSTGKMAWVHAAGFVDSGIDIGIDERPVPGVTEVNSSTSVYLKALAAGQSFIFLEQNTVPPAASKIQAPAGIQFKLTAGKLRGEQDLQFQIDPSKAETGAREWAVIVSPATGKEASLRIQIVH